MKKTIFLSLFFLSIAGCKSTEKGFTQQELDFFESQKIISTWGHLSEDELALTLLGTTCYKKYLVLNKYNYEIESISENEIIYIQPNQARIISKFDTACPKSIHKQNKVVLSDKT